MKAGNEFIPRRSIGGLGSGIDQFLTAMDERRVKTTPHPQSTEVNAPNS
jgi:hypothetical protein